MTPIFFYIVMVQVALYTKHEVRGLSWSLGMSCASHKQITFRVEAKRVYQEVCVLAIGVSYELSCENYAGTGWSGNFLVIENKAYCENFKGGFGTGFKETRTIKIEGNHILALVPKRSN